VGSPPVQTPIVVVKAGGGATFSAECVAALLQAGYDPDWFGSYDHVYGKIKQAQARVADHDAWEKRGKTDPQPKEPLKPGDRYLANCQSGHISQDATHRAKGGRNNPCANYQYGYDTDKAPCMPQTAGPWDPPGSEHNVASRHEVACALRPPGPNKPYDPAQREEDEKKRLDLVVNDRRPPEREPLTAKPSSTAATSIPAGGGAASSSGAPDPKGTESSSPQEQKKQAEKAVECINEFKKAAMAAMRSQVTQDRIDKQDRRRVAGNGGPQGEKESDADYAKRGDAYRADLRKKAGEAEKDANDVSKERARLAQSGGGQQTAAKSSRAAADAAPDDAAAQDKAREKGERLQETKGTVSAAESAEAMMQAEATKARNKSNGAEKANCEAEEGAKLAGMTDDQRAAVAQTGGINKGAETARTPSVTKETRAQFNETQAADPKGTLDA
jgi:hypothetical protein